ncbi:hypothetical protein HIM_07987 [Hirsutella minnesotensis 3608]|uniref:Uncharacterized protein n=1 Tax=Hirsutella minnesotensis 3608 TaxID=1043627 RepID=A0A0F7ZT76_9HYPO|nr:hypothetical protein HIM_07987 [Hirsutella minnesotensis 3608]
MAVESATLRAHSTACPRGKAFYSCVGNHYQGCCSQDPCDLLTCPDDVPVFLGDHDAGGERGLESLVEQSTVGSATASSRPKTDSGVTHTLPGSIVTVTRHTVVFSEAPSSTAAPSDASGSAGPASATGLGGGIPSASTAAGSPTDTSSLADANGAGAGAGISLGGIVGSVAGGLVFGAILVILAIAWRRRRRDQAEAESESAHFQESLRGGDDAEKEHEQHLQQPISAHTTGTQASGDPFAPFGGRFDQDPYRPASGTFEMDGAGMAPVELPAEPASRAKAVASEAAQSYRPYVPPAVPAADPRANLNSIKTDSGRAGYVNHWNQWKALGVDEDRSPVEKGEEHKAN